MAKDPETLMILIDFYADLRPGARLLASDPLVKACPRLWVPFAEGDRAVMRRKAEIERERYVATEQAQSAAIADRMKQGTKILPSDDMTAAAAKEAVQMDSRLELAFDKDGFIIGAKYKNAEAPVRSGYVAE